MNSNTDDNYTYDDDYYENSKASVVCNYGRHSANSLPFLYCLLFLLGLLGNALVVWVIVTGMRLRSVTDVCLLNLALTDLLLLSSLPFLAHQARDQWIFGDVLCKVVLGTYHVGFYGGIFFITLMSMDRYLAIVHAILALKARTRSFGIFAAGVTWVAGILASFPEMKFLEVQSSNGNDSKFCAPLFPTKNNPLGTSHWWSIFGLFKMNILSLISFVIMAYCYGRIIRTLLSSHSSKKQTIWLIVVVVVVFLCCWVPYNIASVFKALELMHVYSSCRSSQNIRTALQVTEVVAYSHSCINPLLYVFVGERFRRQLLRSISRAPCGLSHVVRRFIEPESLRGSSHSQTTSLNRRSTTV